MAQDAVRITTALSLGMQIATSTEMMVLTAQMSAAKFWGTCFYMHEAIL